MVQVLTALALASAISATTALESTPHERKAPSGTSATMRSVTAARIRWTRCSAASPSLARMRREKSGAHQQTGSGRSEEHTSELQSLMRISDTVFCVNKKSDYKIDNSIDYIH